MHAVYGLGYGGPLTRDSLLFGFGVLISRTVVYVGLYLGIHVSPNPCVVR